MLETVSSFVGTVFSTVFSFTTIILTVVFLALLVFLAVLFRRVVPTNMVHIVQSRKKTTSYGTGNEEGNVYYKWPRWMPLIGVTVIELPVSNFDLTLKDYEAYDKDRVPFMVDITAFFRINDTAMAAQRVSSIEMLNAQLKQIVQGAVRKVLASDVIDKIMLERATFGQLFTQEVKEQLTQWGVETVKTMELMDIRDHKESQVITNIMAKKTSQIEMESRKEVANNKKQAETAEIEARQAVDVRRQEAEQVVGQRTAEKDKAVGVANQQARQEVLVQEKDTREREMDVQRVAQVRAAEITREQAVVGADQDKQTKVIVADGHLEAEKRRANAIEAVGNAEGAAERAMQMAPVSAAIALAEKIGTNGPYMQYLALIEAVKAHIVVGGKQAEALQKADVKVIANAGKPTEGMRGVMDLFTSQGGTNMAAAIEAFAQSPFGKSLLDNFGVKIAPAQSTPQDGRKHASDSDASHGVADPKPETIEPIKE